MQWPADHPAVTDEGLAPWVAGVDEVCPSGRPVRVLRHLAGRRVATLVETDTGPAVLKIFASPRARGNDRRLQRLGAATRPGLVPQSLGVDRSGHVSLVSWVEGTVFEQQGDAAFVESAIGAGHALRELHSCRVQLDRAWTWEREVEQLRRWATDSTRAVVESVIASTSHLRTEPLVAAHRDCTPKQVVATASGTSWIDLDDAAMAPPGLDVGNMLAHLRRDAALGRRSWPVGELAALAFLSAYGPVAGDVAGWECLATVRLAGLAETRDASPEDSAAILELLGTGVPR